MFYISNEENLRSGFSNEDIIRVLQVVSLLESRPSDESRGSSTRSLISQGGGPRLVFPTSSLCHQKCKISPARWTLRSDGR